MSGLVNAIPTAPEAMYHVWDRESKLDFWEAVPDFAQYFANLLVILAAPHQSYHSSRLSPKRQGDTGSGISRRQHQRLASVYRDLEGGPALAGFWTGYGDNLAMTWPSQLWQEDQEACSAWSQASC